MISNGFLLCSLTARSAEEIKGLINKVKFQRTLARPSASKSKQTTNIKVPAVTGVATIAGKNRVFFSRSGNSQGILDKVREIV